MTTKTKKVLLYGIPILLALFFIVRTVKAGTKSDLAPIVPPVPLPPDDLNPNIDNSTNCRNRYDGQGFPLLGWREYGSEFWLTRNGTRLRADHSTDSTIIKTYPAGVRMMSLEIWTDMEQAALGTDEELNWYKVVEADNHCVIGWMRSDVIDNIA